MEIKINFDKILKDVNTTNEIVHSTDKCIKKYNLSYVLYHNTNNIYIGKNDYNQNMYYIVDLKLLITPFVNGKLRGYKPDR